MLLWLGAFATYGLMNITYASLPGADSLMKRQAFISHSRSMPQYFVSQNSVKKLNRAIPI